ncbi:MAG: glycosyltransferase family 2 protein [Phycisphaerales bacterium]|nr:MAG: glycosyltransferase family 2 protein [Phycisphaerales bacterium]
MADESIAPACPCVSIGLPVYNGERHVREAIDSILSQTFEDFELIISDNASTDRTTEICQTYAARDRRIKYFHNRENIGGMRNANRVFELSSGTYFKWAAHDDVLARTNLERCVEALDRDASAVLCFCDTRFIDKDSKTVGHYVVPLDCTGLSRTARFRRIVNLPVPCHGIMTYGMHRSSALKQTRLFGSYFEWDQVLIVEMALLGNFVRVPEELYWARKHRGQGSRTPGWRQRAVWMDPSFRGGVLQARCGMIWERFVAVRRSECKPREKALCYTYLTGFAQRRVRRAVVHAGWRAWTGIKPRILATSRYTHLPLRVWALIRYLRSAGWSKLFQGLRKVACMSNTELASSMVQVVLESGGSKGQRLVADWLEGPSEGRRLAAAQAVRAYINESRSDILDEAYNGRAECVSLLKEQLSREQSGRVRHAIVHALLAHAEAKRDLAIAGFVASGEELDQETVDRLVAHFADDVALTHEPVSGVRTDSSASAEVASGQQPSRQI